MNLEVTRHALSENFIEDVSDHKVLKVRFSLRKVRRSESETENKNTLNPDMFKSILPQRVLRELANDNEILERMMSERRSIKTPAFEYFQDIAREKVAELE